MSSHAKRGRYKTPAEVQNPSKLPGKLTETTGAQLNAKLVPKAVYITFYMPF